MLHSVSQLYPALLALAGDRGTPAGLGLVSPAREPPAGAAAARRSGPSGSATSWSGAGSSALGADCSSRCPRPGGSSGANLLLVLGVLYAARGLAVFFGAARASGRAGAAAVLLLISMFLLPFVVGGLTLLGLADTWLDFRRRLVDADHRRVRPMIEVILREDVKSLGKAGELVRVKPGYARNFLLPQGLAFEATEGNKKRIAAETRARGVRNQAERTEAERFAAELGAVTLTLTGKAGEEGKLFGSITAQDIADALAAQGHHGRPAPDRARAPDQDARAPHRGGAPAPRSARRGARLGRPGVARRR